MTARYFGINSLAGAFRTSTSVVESTTAGRFDSTYVSNAIAPSSNVDYFEIKAPFLDGSSSISGTLYLRYDHYYVSGVATDFVTLLSGGTNAYRIRLTTGTTWQVYYWNTGTSAWVAWGSSFTLGASTLRTLMLKLTLNSGFELYSGGTLVASSATVPTNGVSTVDDFRFSASSSSDRFSQIMCADYDIRDAHLMPATFNGNSASNTGGTGTYTDINETALDETTAEAVASVGGKMGQTHAAITVPAGLGIAALVINARGRVSGGVVTDGKLGVRSGGTNYSGSALVYNAGYEPRSAIWASDPATSGAWTQTSFNNAETYIEGA